MSTKQCLSYLKRYPVDMKFLSHIDKGSTANWWGGMGWLSRLIWCSSGGYFRVWPVFPGIFLGGGGRGMSIHFEIFETLLTACWVVAMAVGAFYYYCFVWLYDLITQVRLVFLAQKAQTGVLFLHVYFWWLCLWQLMHHLDVGIISVAL